MLIKVAKKLKLAIINCGIRVKKKKIKTDYDILWLHIIMSGDEWSLEQLICMCMDKSNLFKINKQACVLTKITPV